MRSSAPQQLDFLRRHRRRYPSFAPVRSRSYAAISAELTMAAASAVASGSARVAVAQMTSINDLAANFTSCSRLVKETGSENAHLCNTHDVIDDARIIRSTYRKIHLYVIGCSSFKMCSLWERE